MQTDRIKPMVMTTFDSSTLTGGFDFVVETKFPLAILKVFNASDVNIIISYNGTDNNDFCFSGNKDATVFQLAHLPNNNVSLLPKGTKIYFKANAGAGQGNIFLTGYGVER
jgi:hypothetical protein